MNAHVPHRFHELANAQPVGHKAAVRAVGDVANAGNIRDGHQGIGWRLDKDHPRIPAYGAFDVI